MKRTAMTSHGTPATYDDLKSILGNLDETKLLPILALRPTLADVEEASIWLGGAMPTFSGLLSS